MKPVFPIVLLFMLFLNLKVNENRATIGLRSVEPRNELVDVEEETSMKLYLFGGPWQLGKILPEGF